MIICKVSKLDMPREMWGDKVEWSRDCHCDDFDIIVLRGADDTIKWEERDLLMWYERGLHFQRWESNFWRGTLKIYSSEFEFFYSFFLILRKRIFRLKKKIITN